MDCKEDLIILPKEAQRDLLKKLEETQKIVEQQLQMRDLEEQTLLIEKLELFKKNDIRNIIDVSTKYDLSNLILVQVLKMNIDKSKEYQRANARTTKEQS